MEPVKRTGLYTLHKYFRKYKYHMIAGFAVLVGTNLLAMAIPWLVKDGADLVSESLKNGGAEAVRAQLVKYAAAILAVAIVAGLFRFLARRTIIWASRSIEADLRREVFEHLLKLTANYYQRTPTGDIIARLSNDLEAVRMVAGPSVMYLMNTILVCVFAFTLMIIISPKLTLYSLLSLPLLSVLMWKVGQQIHRRFLEVQNHFSSMSAFVQENLSGIRVVKAYRREEYQEEKFKLINHKYVNLNMSLARIRAMFMPSIMFLIGVIVVTVIWVGGREVIIGALSIGELIGFKLYLMMLIWPMLAIGWVISLYQRGTASLSRIDEILNEQPDVASISEPVQVSVRGQIEFQNLSFRYPNAESDVLRDINFSISPGETVSIVGATGSGRSTLVSLLVREFPVPAGSIYLDGLDINKMSLDDLRSAIGFVPQESFLFSDTIASNIAFSQDNIDEKRVRQAAAAAAFDNEIESFTHGYDTILGERGITLSGGQKQRAAIARAILKRPPILVFDDSFSAVDTQTEELILSNLTELMGKVTLILISHRVSTIKRADRIIVLEHGRVAEIGTHKELAARQGVYYKIIRRELLAGELEAL